MTSVRALVLPVAPTSNEDPPFEDIDSDNESDPEPEALAAASGPVPLNPDTASESPRCSFTLTGSRDLSSTSKPTSTIHIVQDLSTTGQGSIGLSIWDASLVLIRHLTHSQLYPRPAAWQNTRVLELGAGTGLVGLAAAALGAKETVLTDLPFILPVTERNVKLNARSIPGWVGVAPFTWGGAIDHLLSARPEGSSPKGFDWIIAADCAYYDESYADLVASLVALTLAGIEPVENESGTWTSRTKILFGWETRKPDKEVLLAKMIREAGFTAREIEGDALHPQWSDPLIPVFEFSVSNIPSFLTLHDPSRTPSSPST